MQGAKDDLGELVWIFYGLVAALVLIIGVVQTIEREHHTVGYWLVLGSWLVTFAALSWGFRRRRRAGGGAGGHQVHLPALQAGERETVEQTPTTGGGFRLERHVQPTERVIEAAEPSKDEPPTGS